LFKEENQRLLAMKCHPDWWADENNFAVLMAPDESVYLTHCQIKTYASGQKVLLDRIARGKNRLDWAKEAD